MTNPGYAWPRYITGPADHVHALGVVSLNYNLLEAAMVAIMDRYMPEGHAEFFFDLLNNEDRLATIRFVAQSEEPEVQGHIEHLIKYFSTCKQNRNILMHSAPGLGSSLLPDKLVLNKRSDGQRITFLIKVGTLRRVADQMWKGLVYLIDVDRHIHVRDMHDEGASENYKEQFPIPALPTKPELPRKLDPHQSIATIKTGG